jgi:hypothetical protein
MHRVAANAHFSNQFQDFSGWPYPFRFATTAGQLKLIERGTNPRF